jgi:hypothetical protein
MDTKSLTEQVVKLTKTRLDILRELARGFMFIVINPEAKHIGVALVGCGDKYTRIQLRSTFDMFKLHGLISEIQRPEFLDKSEEYRISPSGTAQLEQWIN